MMIGTAIWCRRFGCQRLRVLALPSFLEVTRMPRLAQLDPCQEGRRVPGGGPGLAAGGNVMSHYRAGRHFELVLGGRHH